MYKYSLCRASPELLRNSDTHSLYIIFSSQCGRRIKANDLVRVPETATYARTLVTNSDHVLTVEEQTNGESSVMLLLLLLLGGVRSMDRFRRRLNSAAINLHVISGLRIT